MDQLAAHEMHVFCRIVDSSSFAGAAEGIGMTPSAVSKLVTRLESRLGVQLLTRTTRRLALTAEGETYLRSARRIVADIESAEADVMEFASEPSGQLKVNTSVVFGRHVLTPILPEFMERYPKISFNLGVTERHIDIFEEQVDIALRTGPLGDSSLIARRVGETERVICASPEYLSKFGMPKTPSDLRHHQCMAAGGFAQLMRWPFVTGEGVNMIDVSGRFVCDNLDVIVDMLLAGQGIGRMSRIIVARHLQSGDLVELFADSHQRDPLYINALMPPGGNRAPKVRVFLDFLVGHPLLKARL